MSLLSRYYFVFLAAYFIFCAIRIITKPMANAISKGQGIVAPLLVVFAFLILAFDGAFSLATETLIFGGLVLAFVVAGSIIIRRIFRNPCPIITNVMFLLLSLGFIMLHRLSPGLAMRQLAFAAAGLAASLFVPLFFRIFRNFWRAEKLYIFLCLGLVGIVTIADVLASITGLPLIAVDEFGATRWISIAGFSFQSSEFAKPIFAVYLACAFRAKPSTGKLIFIGASSAAVIGILVLQRDLGSALMFFAVFITVFYAATGNKILTAAGLAAITAASIAAYSLFPHLRVRVAAWRNPWPLIDDWGFQITQSLFAIGTWGAFGSGLGRGLPDRIPVVERDFIFAAVAEEFGWLFAVAIIAIYAILLARSLQIARRAANPLHALMTLGFAVFLTFQAFVAIGGNIKFIPMTGITLPFMSYGGSSVFVSILMIGGLNWLNGKADEGEAENADYSEQGQSNDTNLD